MKSLILYAVLVFLHVNTYGQTDYTNDSMQARTAPTKLVFCGGVENDLPVGVSDRFLNDTTASRYIYAYYSQPTQLMMKQVIMEIRSDNKSDEEDRKTFNVRPKWKYTFLKCYFPKEGSYTVMLYDVDNNILARGTISIHGGGQ